MLQKIKRIVLVFVFMLLPLLAPLALTQTSYADGPCPGSKAPFPVVCSGLPVGCPGSTATGNAPGGTLTCLYGPSDSSYSCPATKCVFGDGSPALMNGQSIGSDGTVVQGGDCTAGLSKCDILTRYLNPFIKFLSALVGIAVVISIIIGGIQYGSSAGDPQKVSAAKNRIRNAIIALVAFLFLFALLNFLIPGGLR